MDGRLELAIDMFAKVEQAELLVVRRKQELRKYLANLPQTHLGTYYVETQKISDTFAQKHSDLHTKGK